MASDAASPALRFLVLCAAFVVVVAGMRAAAPLLTPFLLAVFIAVLAAPPLFYLKGRGVPEWAALLAVVLLVVLIGGLLALLVGGSLDDFATNLPGYEQRLREQVGDLRGWLEGFGINLPRQTFSDLLDPAAVMRLAGQTVSGLGGMLANGFLILLTVIFILLEASHLPAKLQAVMGGTDASLERLGRVARDINRYMAIKAGTSLLTGVGVALWLWVQGVDFPLLWGVLAFLLNFVPSIGSIIAAVPAVLLALVQLGAGGALWAMAGFLAVNGLVGNVLEPRVMGRGLGLSTLVVFLSLVFWGWVLGPVGMFLSVPLTMALKIALDATPQTRPVAILLGSEIPRAEMGGTDPG